MTSLKDRVAIVTGASGGFGRAIALKLAQSEAAVALVDLRAPIETATMAGSSAIAFAGDVSVDATRARLGEEIDRTFGRADIVVNNAVAFSAWFYRRRRFRCVASGLRGQS
jgi:NAD(P)-dependent dehydrogenase (short-subunit alcohol dehydrogenase family)